MLKGDIILTKLEKIEYLNSLLPKNDEGFYLDVYGKKQSYNGNNQLIHKDIALPLREEHIIEIQKCSNDIIYFIENYCRIISLDKGLVFPELRDYQIEMLENYQNNRFNVVLSGRQTGKSITTLLYLLWILCFKPDNTIGMVANKWAMVSENLNRLLQMFLDLPIWLKPTVKVFNKTSIVTNIGTKVYISTCSADALRGYSVNILVVDEVAFIPANVWNEFTASVIPTISTSEKSQILLTSTPMGLNHFHKIWRDAEEGKNSYHPFKVEWFRVPGRDENFKDMMIKTLDLLTWMQEYECSFIGSADTLVDMKKLSEIKFKPEISYPFFSNDIKIYEPPLQDHKYIVTADGAKGTLDNFALGIFDVSTIPFKQVGAGEIKDSYLNAPPIFYNILKSYNNAYFICENNDGAGTSVLDILSQQYDYTNIYKEPDKKWLGHRTTKGNRTKLLSNMKMFIENDKLILNDRKTVSELTTFVNKKGKYEADTSKHDDYVMATSLLFVPFLHTESIDDYEKFLETLKMDIVENDDTGEYSILFSSLNVIETYEDRDRFSIALHH